MSVARISEKSLINDLARLQRRETIAWLGLGTAAIALIALTVGLIIRQSQSFVNLQHKYVITIGLLDILSDVENAEAREREYLVTKDASQLERYNRSRNELDKEFDRLRTLVGNNPKEQTEIDKLQNLVHQKVDELQLALFVRSTAGREAAQAILRSGRGRYLMDSVRQEVSAMERDEQNTLAGFSHSWELLLRIGSVCLIGSALLACGCLVIAWIALARSAALRRGREQELRASEKRFETLCEQAPVGIYETDAEGRCVYTNRKWSAMSGLSASDSLGYGWKVALHPDDRERVFHGWQPAAVRGTTWEYRLLTAQEETRWIRASGGPIYSDQGALIGYVGTVEDVTERKRAAERFRLVFEAAPSGMVMVDSDGKIILVNSRTEKLFGYKREELIGQSIEILVPEASRARLVELRRAYFAHLVARPMGIAQELYVERKDGTRFPVEIGLNPIETEEGSWVLGSIVDITERRRAEARLRESEERFRNMADTAPVLIWVAGPDKRCTFFNKIWLEFTGRAMEQELGHGWAEGVHATDFDRCIASYSEAFDARRPFRMEYRLRRADGEYRWMLNEGVPRFSPDGSFAGYIGSCVDVTEKRRAEEERQKFVSLADRSLEFISMCDIDFKPFYVNGAGMHLVGLANLEAACRVKIQDYFFPEDQSFITNEFFPRVLREGHGEVEIRFRHFKTGEAIWMLYNVFNIFDVRGTHVGWATVSIDITQRKKADGALREALHQLQVITDNMAAGVTRCSRSLRYLWVSRSYAVWLGRPRDEVAGQAILDVLGQEGYKVIRPYIEKVVSGERVEYEERVTYRGIGPRWVHAVYEPTRGDDQTVDGWIAVVTDITDRHEAEERRRESEERFRAIFFQAAVGIAQTSIDGRWLLLNDRFCEILGYSQEELLEKTFIDITYPDDREASLDASRKFLAGEISSWSSQKRYIRKDGATVWARLFVSLVRDQRNQAQYFVSVVEDITKEIQAQHALQQSRQQLRALAGRLINAQEDERKRIARELHDDLSQKLALLAFDTGSLVSAPPPSVEEMKDPLRILQKRAVQLSQDVRQISHRLHPSILEDLGLPPALNELCEEFSTREGIEVLFEEKAVPQALPVEIASCLYRVAQEALHNVSKHARASEIHLKISGSPGGIQLYIRDNGAGFDSQAALSRPGLGIVSMKERVMLVQGEFSVHSEPGQGTEVVVFVPLFKRAA